MRGIVELWLSQLYKLTVLWPAWLLTPQGLGTVFAPRMLWRIALLLMFAAAVSAMLQAGLPPDMALIGSGDVMAYVDVVVIAWAAGASSIAKLGMAWLTRRVRRKPVPLVAARRGGRAAMRRRRLRRPPPPANDDGCPGGRWTVAA